MSLPRYAAVVTHTSLSAVPTSGKAAPETPLSWPPPPPHGIRRVEREERPSWGLFHLAPETSTPEYACPLRVRLHPPWAHALFYGSHSRGVGGDSIPREGNGLRGLALRGATLYSRRHLALNCDFMAGLDAAWDEPPCGVVSFWGLSAGVQGK